MRSRLLVFALLALAAASWSLPWRTPRSASVGAAEPKEVDRLNKDIKDRDQEIAGLHKKVSHLEGTLRDKEKQLNQTQTQLDKLQGAAYVHVVFFNLKSDAPDGEADTLRKDADKMLSPIKSVRGLWVGQPPDSSTGEDTVKDFQVGLTVAFDNADGLQQYLKDAAHKKFKDKHGKYWDKVTAYDFVRPKQS